MGRLAAFVAAVLVCRGSIGLASDVPAVSLGGGRSMVVEYDLGSKPVRKYIGLKKPVDITPLVDGTLLLVDEEAGEVMVFDADGTVRWREQIGEHPLRARPRPGGGFLVTSGEEVIALRSDRSVEWRLPVKRIKAAVPLANGNILTATNDAGQGWLTEMTPTGAVRRRSKPKGWYDASGAWIEEQADRYFRSIWSLDVGPDGTIFTSNFDGGGLRLLSPQFENLHIFPVLGHVSDTRIGSAGELIAVAPEDFLVWRTLPGDSPKSFQTDLRPMCANFSLHQTVLVGMYWEPERSVLNATAARTQQQPEVPWRQRALPVPLLGALIGLVSSLILRWPALDQRRLPENAGMDVSGRMAGKGASAAQGVRWTTAHRVVAVVCALVVAGATTLTWQGMEGIQRYGLSKDVWRFVIGCVAAGIALRFLNVIDGCAGTLSSFTPSQWQAPPRTRPARTLTLGALSIGSLGVCLLVLRVLPAEQALAIALWLAAQIWLVAAALPAVVPDVAERDAGRRYWPLLGLLLLAATLMRLWQIGYYPDLIHHDHSAYGNAALRTLDGGWKPFFIMDPWTSEGMSRAWLVPCIAALQLFGPHHWVLRLTGAISGVLVVWGTYLLGTSLFNRRVGLIAAVLVTVNNGLLLYSRLPYVMDSAWPLVLAVHCAVVALKRGCRLHWTLAGLLSGWAMLTVRQFTMYPFIGGAMLFCLACLYPRQLWRQRWGLLWFAWGAAAAYAPMLPHMLADIVLTTQARGVVVFLKPDGSLRWDGALWATQLLRSFGSIIYYRDSGPWGISTGAPICLRYESCLFGIGLVYLLTSRRTPAMFVLVLWMTVSIFLGCAALPNPPTLYHFLVAIVPIMITTAVGLDRVLALTDRWRLVWRAVPAMAAVALLAVISAGQIDAFWQAVRRPAPGSDGQTVYRSGPMVLVARFVSEHPDYRYYMVRGRTEQATASPVLSFFAAHTDMSDVSTDLAEVLPVPPVEPAVGAAFVVLPGRSAQREAISTAYPGATTTELRYANGSVWVYRVPASAVRKAYEASRPLTGGSTTAALSN
jgi:4-amino-4-deoxy-L-arabinose transferase-like glycosyltransferase